MTDGPHSNGRALVRRLLAFEARDARAQGNAAAAAAVCQKLFQEVGQFIGPDGFKALLARSLNRARNEFPFLSKVRIGDASTEDCLADVSGIVGNQDATEALDGMTAVLGDFIDLLGTFIGDDLTLRMIQRRWPDVPQKRPIGGDEREKNG